MGALGASVMAQPNDPERESRRLGEEGFRGCSGSMRMIERVPDVLDLDEQRRQRFEELIAPDRAQMEDMRVQMQGTREAAESDHMLQCASRLRHRPRGVGCYDSQAGTPAALRCSASGTNLGLTVP